MIEIKKDFSPRELFWFGPLFGLFVGLLAGILIRRFELVTFGLAFCAAASVLILVYYLVPAWQTAIYRGWLYSVAPIGWVVSHVLLGLLYYLLVTPIGLIMRLVGYDPMQRKLDRSATTYWQLRPEPSQAKRYFRQF